VGWKGARDSADERIEVDRMAMETLSSTGGWMPRRHQILGGAHAGAPRCRRHARTARSHERTRPERTRL